jgi:signal peptide peptidase SppA
MPLPSPRTDEERQNFLSRCMGNDTMKRDFPDQKQRAAVCFRQWRSKKRASAWAPLGGVWAVLPDWLALHHGQLDALVDGQHLPARAELALEARAFDVRELITVIGNQVGLVQLHGPMLKRAGFWEQLFGFTGTEMIRAAIHTAAADDEIKAILLHVESPGGHVAGVQDLADTVRDAAARKPTAVHIDDLGASAAYWASAYATRLTASPMAEVGSLGTMAVVADVSQGLAQAGVTVHVVSTGPMKGLGVPGTQVTKAHLEDIQRRVDGANAFFLRAVQQGRKLSAEQLERVADGRVFLAQEAKRLGLIDEVRSLDAAIRDLGRLGATSRTGDTRERIAQRRAAIQELREDGACPQ